MGFALFDCNQVTVNAFGIDVNSGREKGAFVKTEHTDDDFTEHQSADGLVSRARKANNVIDITLTLAQTSATNAKLSAVRKLDRLQHGGGVGPFTLRDRKGTTLVFCEKAWIVKAPAVEIGEEVKTREWKLRGVAVTYLVGGNEA